MIEEGDRAARFRRRGHQGSEALGRQAGPQRLVSLRVQAEPVALQPVGGRLVPFEYFDQNLARLKPLSEAKAARPRSNDYDFDGPLRPP